jgi:hypothetical protein
MFQTGFCDPPGTARRRLQPSVEWMVPTDEAPSMFEGEEYFLGPLRWAHFVRRRYVPTI